MNNTKKALIITAIVLNFLSVGLEIFYVVRYFMLPQNERVAIFYAVFDILQIVAYLICNGLLIYSIARNGAFFRSRYGYYMTAVVLAMILNLFSVSSILLIVTLFLSDIVWVKPDKEEKTIVVEEEKSVKNKEKEIERLRKLKEEGKITELEYQEELMKLL
jgi:signal transduction histidine kinase